MVRKSIAFGGVLAALAAVTAASLSVDGCAPRARDVSVEAIASGHEVVDLELSPRVGDVFAFAVDVEGHTTGDAALVACSARAGTTELPVTLEARSFRVRVPLHEGANELDVACRDTEDVVHRAPRARFHGRLADEPVAKIVAARDADGVGLVLDTRESTPSPGSRAPLRRTTWSGIAAGDGGRITVTSPGVVRLRVEDARGRASETAVRVAPEPGGTRLRLVDGAEPRRGGDLGFVYGVHPPLYGAPGLPALAKKLPALADLGVDVLRLTPPYASPRGDFGYAVTNHYRVRRELGTEEDLAKLVEQAHALGLRVLVDFVPNHTSDAHPWFRDATRLGRGAHGARFYARDDAGAPTHSLDWANLPNLAFDEPEVNAFVADAARYWQRRARIDGFRVNAVWGLKERTPAAVPAWVRAVRAEDPDAILVAEASAREPFWLASGFDAAYDWTDELGKWAWADVWSSASGVPDRLWAALERARERIPDEARTRVLRYLDDADTGPRFVTRNGPGMTRAALAALFTVPGTPALFSGSEVGAEYDPHAAGSTLGDETDPHGLRPWVKELAALRAAHPALRSATVERVAARNATTKRPDPDVLAFRRQDAASGETLLVAIRFGDRAGDVLVETGAARAVRDVRRRQRVAVTAGAARVALGAWSATVLALE